MEQQDLFDSLSKDNLNMFEQAGIMHKLCFEYHMTQNQLAKKLGISQSNIGNKIRLLQFNSNEKSQILKHNLSERHARTLLRISPPKRIKLIETVGNMHLTVQQTEELVEKYRSEAEPQPISSTKASFNSYSITNYISDIQSGAERLRSLDYRVSCLTEAGDTYYKITLLIKNA